MAAKVHVSRSVCVVAGVCRGCRFLSAWRGVTCVDYVSTILWVGYQFFRVANADDGSLTLLELPPPRKRKFPQEIEWQ